MVGRVLAVSALLALSCAPSAMGATLKGHVFGQPYALKGGKAAVPLLIDKRHANKARLTSRFGLVKVREKTTKVKGAKKISTRLIRVNDRLKIRTRVRRKVREDSYWTMTAKKAVVIARSSTLSAAELQELVEQLGTRLDSLSAFVGQLAAYTVQNVNSLRSDVNGLKSDLATLRAEFDALSAQVTALSAQLSAMEAKLQAQIDALVGDVAGLREQLEGALADIEALQVLTASLQTQLTALQAQVTGLAADLAALDLVVAGLKTQLGDLSTLGGTVVELLAGADPGDLATALGDIGALQTAVDGLGDVINDPVTGLVKQVDDVTATVGGAGSGLVQSVGVLQDADVATAADIAALELVVGDAGSGLVKQVNDLDALLNDPGGVVADLTALEAVVGDATSGLVQQVNGLSVSVDALCGDLSLLDALCVTSTGA